MMTFFKSLLALNVGCAAINLMIFLVGACLGEGGDYLNLIIGLGNGLIGTPISAWLVREFSA